MTHKALGVLVALLAMGAPVAQASGGRAVRLGVSERNERGFGHARPPVVYLGGDPTGLAEHIHWQSWGGRQALGTARAEFVWPGTCVGCNGFTSARIVAFARGRCRGRPSYNAVEWYFPQYGEAFNPTRGIPTCGAAYVESVPQPVSCPDVILSSGAQASEVQVTDMSCEAAAPIIAAAPAAQYAPGGGRFTQAGFLCGTQGQLGGRGPALFACQAGERELSFTVEGPGFK